MIVILPEICPAAPMPAIARPRIKTVDVCARAQMIDPISKMTSAVVNNRRISKNVNSLPKDGCKAIYVIMYPVPYHPISYKAPNPAVIRGAAVAVAGISTIAQREVFFGNVRTGHSLIELENKDTEHN